MAIEKRMTRRGLLGGASAIAIDYVLPNLAAGEEKTSAEKTENLGWEVIRDKVQKYGDEIRKSGALISGTPEEAFELLARQPLVPRHDALTSQSRSLFYPQFIVSKESLDDGMLHDGMPWPSVAVRYRQPDGSYKFANAVRVGASTLLVTARTIAQFGGVEGARQALRKGHDTALYEVPPGMTAPSTDVQKISRVSNRELHGAYAVVAGLLRGKGDKAAHPSFDAGTLVDLAQVPVLRALVEKALIDRIPETDEKLALRSVIAQSLVLISSEEPEVSRAFSNSGIGAPVCVHTGKDISDYGLAGIVSDVIKLEHGGNVPVYAYLVQGPDIIGTTVTRAK